jgi:hypothetical protein
MRFQFIFLYLIFFSCHSSNEFDSNSTGRNSLIPLIDTTIQGDSIQIIKSIHSPIFLLDSNLVKNEETPFQSFVMEHAMVKLIPNKHFRDKLGIHQIKNITGVTHFFLDHDLTSGFVHPYTQNYFNKLSPDDFVLKFEPIKLNKTIGKISYVRKKSLTMDDKLGENVAYFREWKLSEIDWKYKDTDILINVIKSSFSYFGYCPKAISTKDNSIIQQIPILVDAAYEGYNSLNKMGKLSAKLGGTVVIIWEDTVQHKILFQDIHSSWKAILLQAILISKKYHTDPTIAIGDAGPYSPKILANRNFNLNTNLIDDLFYSSEWFGAGFGYVPIAAELFSAKVNNDSTTYFVKLK